MLVVSTPHHLRNRLQWHPTYSVHIISIQNTLTGDDVTLSMAEVNEEYVSFLKWHQVFFTVSANYKKKQQQQKKKKKKKNI